MIFAAACTVGVKGSDPALESEQTTRRPLALPIRPRLKNPSAPTTRLECLTGSKERKGLLTSACDELLVAIVSTEQRERHNTEQPLAKPPPISKYQYSCHFQDLQLQQKQSHDEHNVLGVFYIKNFKEPLGVQGGFLYQKSKEPRVSVRGFFLPIKSPKNREQAFEVFFSIKKFKDP